MEMHGRVIYAGNDQYFLVENDEDSEWYEGAALDTTKREMIYYNGDYGESRPENIKRLLAEPHDTLYVRMGQSLEKINIVTGYVQDTIEESGGLCTIENLKFNGSYVIKLIDF